MAYWWWVQLPLPLLLRTSVARPIISVGKTLESLVTNSCRTIRGPYWKRPIQCHCGYSVTLSEEKEEGFQNGKAGSHVWKIWYPIFQSQKDPLSSLWYPMIKLTGHSCSSYPAALGGAMVSVLGLGVYSHRVVPDRYRWFFRVEGNLKCALSCRMRSRGPVWWIRFTSPSKNPFYQWTLFWNTCVRLQVETSTLNTGLSADTGSEEKNFSWLWRFSFVEAAEPS